MKRIVSIIVVCVFLGIGMVHSHAPSNLELNFDKETLLLSVDFEHKVKDAESHFVYRVKVRLNEKDKIEQKLDRQDTENGGSLIYKINGVKSGDVIEVRLDCINGGAKTEKMTIE